MAVIRTGVYPHMPIANHRKIQILYNTGRHGPSGSLFFAPHTVRTKLTTVQRVINFSIFDPGAYPWAKVHQKGRRPTTRLDLASYKISAHLRKRSMRYVLPKFSPLFGLGANHWAKVHQKGRWPASHPALPSYQISSRYVNPRQTYLLPKIQNPVNKETNKKTKQKTVTNISPPCLSACGDNNVLLVFTSLFSSMMYVTAWNFVMLPELLGGGPSLTHSPSIFDVPGTKLLLRNYHFICHCVSSKSCYQSKQQFKPLDTIR